MFFFASFRSVSSLHRPFVRRRSTGFQDSYTVTVADLQPGTSIDLGGDFALSLGGSRSQYLPSDASARDVKLALEALDTVGTVDVERNDGDAEVRHGLNLLLLEALLLKTFFVIPRSGLDYMRRIRQRAPTAVPYPRCSARTIASRTCRDILMPWGSLALQKTMSSVGRCRNA